MQVKSNISCEQADKHDGDKHTYENSNKHIRDAPLYLLTVGEPQNRAYLGPE